MKQGEMPEAPSNSIHPKSCPLWRGPSPLIHRPGSVSTPFLVQRNGLFWSGLWQRKGRKPAPVVLTKQPDLPPRMFAPINGAGDRQGPALRHKTRPHGVIHPATADTLTDVLNGLMSR